MKTINKDIQKVAKFAKKGGFKRVLNCVLTDKDYYVATDNYSLLRAKRNGKRITESILFDKIINPVLTEEPILLNAEIIKNIKFNQVIEDAILSSDNNGDYIMNTIDGTTKIKRENCTFPEYNKLIPTIAPIGQVNLNVDYLIDLLKAFKIKKGNIVKISFRGEESPITINGVDDINSHLDALLMPVINHKK